MNKINLYGPILCEGTCEESIREHISPILSLAALTAGDIQMKAEKWIQLVFVEEISYRDNN